MKGAYRCADIWYVDRRHIYDGTVYDGAGNLQLVGASEGGVPASSRELGAKCTLTKFNTPT